MRQKMVFDDVTEYEKFNKMYNGYIQNGVEASRALAMTKEAFWPTKPLTEEGKKAYNDYIFKFGLTPDDAYILASRKDAMRPETPKVSEAPKAQAAPEAPKVSVREEESEAPATKSWLEDWFNPMGRNWLDTFKPFNKFFEEQPFFKDFSTPCWLDFGNGRQNRKQAGGQQGQHGQCNCKGKQENAPANVAPKGASIVDDEIKKVLNSLPKEEVNEKNTKVNIVRNEPNNWEFKVDHTSPDGKSHYWCSQKVVKS